MAYERVTRCRPDWQVRELVDPGAVPVGGASMGSLRWTLGYSPRRRVALLRAGAPIPEERFKQRVPFETVTRTPPP